MKAVAVRKTAVQVPLVAWTLLGLVPFLLITLFALRSTAEIYENPLRLGGELRFENFANAWAGPFGSAGFSVFMLNTAITAIVALVLNLSAASVGAFFASRLSKRLRELYSLVFLIGTIIPLVLLVVPYYELFSRFALVNSPWTLGVAYAALALPTSVLVLVAYFVDFPTELVEAAAVDGLGELGSFLRIVLPLSKGALASVGVLTLVWVWSETQLSVVLLQDSTAQTVAVGILGFQGQFSGDQGAIFAGLAIASIPIIVVYLVFGRWVTKGIALGGVSR